MKKETQSVIRAVFYNYLLLATIATLYFVFSEQKQEVLPKEQFTISKDKAVKYVFPSAIQYLHGEELLTKLKEGGLVIYFRHFSTDHREIEKDATKPQHLTITAEELSASCSQQRPLSDYGRMQAKMVNIGLEKNNIPIGRVLSSPYCRAAEGAEIAFGKQPELQRDLIYRTKTFTREMMSNHIISLLAEKPVEGNTFVLAHRPQMDDIEEISEGEAYIFEPLGNSAFNLIGRVKAEEWLLSSYKPFALSASYLQTEVYNKKPKK